MRLSVVIGFVYFAVLNVVTGVFCQSAIESSQNDHEAMIATFLKNQRVFTTRFANLFHTIDEDGSGMITKDEFEHHLKDPRVIAYFATLDLEPKDAMQLFELLGDDQEIGVAFDDFVMGCLRLKGPAKSCDMARLLFEQKLIKQQLDVLYEQLPTELRQVAASNEIRTPLLS